MEVKNKSKHRAALGELTINDANANAGSSGKGVTVEQIYQKKTQLEHILLRPDSYVGSIEPVLQPMWVFDDQEKKMVQKKITFCPALYKIFDEIIVNACDNKQRDPSMNKLKVTIDAEEGEICVWNNGSGIPIVMHKEHHVYVPELIFGHLLTGSNFDDTKKKTTGGRNGYGAKLANIFSKKFTVETASKEFGKRYCQVFENNMSVKREPKIISWKQSDFTCISFKPDFERFQMTHLDEDIVALFKKRVYDIAGITDKSLKVYLNEELIEINSFPEYIQLYDGVQEVMFDKPDERWQVGVGISDDGFQQVSFVNGICTTKGGQHVNYLADQIATKLIAVVKKKNKGDAVKPAYIKNHMCIYVSALIDNPVFDSQTKETLTTRANAFGSTYTLSDKFFKQVEKSGLVDRILSFAKFKQTAELKKTVTGGKKTRLTGILKLDDANFAGSAKGQNCTLILTEGDSAKALAMSGLSVVGRDYYGVFPLKGKLLNVREAGHAQIVKNEEIMNIVKILGLKYDTKYESTKSLRYGHVMIMADQDHDGSHIKGLVINFIHHFWPSLMGLDNFVQEFITPIVKATKGNRSEVFYTIPEYEAWRAQTNNGHGWEIKYYKGLGTSTAKEGKEYFSDLATHKIGFTYDGERDGDSIDMAFSKKRVEDRKEWLRGFVPGTYVDYAVQEMPYSEFVNKELILFSMADNIRSIPSVVDGFKPSQRKVLFSCFKRSLKKEIKVAQLAGFVSEHSAYHHGEMSLHGTIINMAQDFVGSNNVNLLSPNGQFGTRLLGGKDAASARYVFTKLETITRMIFNPLDDSILSYLEDDGLSIEPQWYMPIIPMALVNGSDGIGTGWSCGIPNYNPLDIISNLRLRIDAQPMLPMQPWYRGFTGTIVQKGSGENFLVQGNYEVIDDSTLVITELPIKTWTQTYKQFLETLLEGGAIKDFKENHTDTTVLFTINLEPAALASIQAAPGGIVKKFKLETSMATSNMHMFDAGGQIKHYASPLDIIEEFYGLRLEYYGLRKDAILKKLDHEILILSNKMRFILAVIDGSIVVNNRKKQVLLEELRQMKFDPIPKKVTSKSEEANEDDEDNGEDNETAAAVSSKDYDYLLSLPLWSLTAERVEKLRVELNEKQDERDIINATSLERMWLRDLEGLESGLNENEAMRVAQEEANIKNLGKKAHTKRVIKKKPKPSKSKYSNDSESSQSDFEVSESKRKAPVRKNKVTPAQLNKDFTSSVSSVIKKNTKPRKSKFSDDSDSSQSDFELSESKGKAPKKKYKAIPAGSKEDTTSSVSSVIKKNTKPSKSKYSYESESSESDFEVSESEPKSPVTKNKAIPAGSKKVIASSALTPQTEANAKPEKKGTESAPQASLFDFGFDKENKKPKAKTLKTTSTSITKSTLLYNKKKNDTVVSSDDDAGGLSLFERLQLRNGKVNATLKPASVPMKHASKSSESDALSGSDDTFVTRKTPKKTDLKKSKAAKKRKNFDLDDTSDEDDVFRLDTSPKKFKPMGAPKPTAKKMAKPKASPKLKKPRHEKKKSAHLSSEDESHDNAVSDIDDDNAVIAPAKERPGRVARTQKQIVYVHSSDEEMGEEDPDESFVFSD